MDAMIELILMLVLLGTVAFVVIDIGNPRSHECPFCEETHRQQR